MQLLVVHLLTRERDRESVSLSTRMNGIQPHSPHLLRMRRLPPLHALRAFEAAARHLHFGRAAEELHLTPTAISHQVRLLEELTGTKLFLRYPRPMRLTDDRAALFPVLRDALDRIADAVDGMAHGAVGRPLIVSVNLSFASRWLLPRLQRLKAETGIELAVEGDDTPVDLHAGTVDFAIRYAAAVPRDFAAHPMFTDRMIPVCAPSVLARYGPVSRPSDLSRFPLVHFRWKMKRLNAPSWERWFAHAAEGDHAAASVTAPRALQLSEELHALEAAIAGQGVSLASDVQVELDIAAGRLVVPIDLGLPGSTFRAVHLKSLRRAAEVRRFAEWATVQVLGD